MISFIVFIVTGRIPRCCLSKNSTDMILGKFLERLFGGGILLKVATVARQFYDYIRHIVPFEAESEKQRVPSNSQGCIYK